MQQERSPSSAVLSGYGRTVKSPLIMRVSERRMEHPALPISRRGNCSAILLVGVSLFICGRLLVALAPPA